MQIKWNHDGSGASLITPAYKFMGALKRLEFGEAGHSNIGNIFYAKDDGQYYVSDGQEWIKLGGSSKDSSVRYKDSSVRYKAVTNCHNCGAPLKYKGNEFESGRVTCEFCGITVSLPLEEP